MDTKIRAAQFTEESDPAKPNITADQILDEMAEPIRRELAAQINAEAAGRQVLETRHGQVWDPLEMAGAFEVLLFKAPLVAVRRKSDHRLGSLFFQHHPRFYFDFQEDQ